jgi:hypothetical protein
MSKALVTDEIEASADTVWELVRDFGGIMKWSAGAVQAVSVEGEGIGAIRTLTVTGGVSLQEKLEARDEAQRSFSYSFAGKVLLPVDRYYATLTVVPIDEGRCRVEWGSTFEPNGATEEQAIAMLEGIYKNGIGGIKQALAS